MENKLNLIFWELTSGCNLRCIHCRAEAKAFSSPDELSREEALSFVDSLVGFANPILVLTGGEPLTRPDVYDIASYATQKGFRVALATNGTLVTKEVANKIVQSGVKRVSISLDGVTSKTHDSFRGIEGSYDEAVRGFKNLKELGMSLQINTTVTNHNKHEIPELLDFCINIGADAFHLFLLVPVGCGLKIHEREQISPIEYEEILNWLYKKSKEVAIHVKATCAPHYFRIMRQNSGRMNPTPTSTGESHSMSSLTRGCLAGTGICFLSHKGEVFPCGYLPILAGNIRSTSIKEIWENSKVFHNLRSPNMLKGKCGICEYRFLCEGCRARAYAQTGDYMEEEPFCIYEPGNKHAVAI
jgi:heme b synthase